jgi:hypothetical protein
MKIEGVVFDFGGVMSPALYPDLVKKITDGLGLDWKGIVEGFVKYRRIMDGDLILVQETHEARDGEIVVALIDGIETGATVKTFYRKNGKIYLTPENKTMGPIIVDDATIVGKVKGVFRYFS